MKKKTLEDKAMELVAQADSYFLLIRSPHIFASGMIYFETDPEAIEVVKKAYEDWQRKKLALKYDKQGD